MIGAIGPILNEYQTMVLPIEKIVDNTKSKKVLKRREKNKQAKKQRRKQKRK